MQEVYYQVRYTPERLQALADVAIAHQQEAAKLYPDSPAVYYYLGEHLLRTQNSVGAKAAYQKAIQFGDTANARPHTRRPGICPTLPVFP